MPTLNMEATPATVWALMQENAVAQKETDRIIKENAAAQREYAEYLKVTERQLKENSQETERQLKESLLEVERQMKENLLEIERQMKENSQETERQMKESSQEIKRQMKESLLEIERQMKESSQETERQMKESSQETERQIKESSLKADRQIAESWLKTECAIKEVDKQIDVLTVKIKELSANVGGVNNSIGDFAEALLTNDLLKKFKALDLDFDDALQNVVIRERGTKRVLVEIDCLLLNTDIALVAEVKANMTRGDVEKHITRMKVLSGKQNGLLKEKKLYGAMAGIKIREKTKEYAKSKGLFVLEPSGDTVKIEAPAGKPAIW
jgi:myosin heavy subunit